MQLCLYNSYLWRKNKETPMDTEYLNRFEERLQQELLRLCTDYHVLDGTLLATEDLDNRWHDLAPEYVADAVEQIRDYPWCRWPGLPIWAWE